MHRLWQDILPGAPSFGIRDDFDFLGGQTVHAAQIVAQVELATGVRLRLRDFLQLGTVEAIAEHVDSHLAGSPHGRGAGVGGHTDGRFSEGDVRRVPLSFAQRRFWKMMARPDASTLHSSSTAGHPSGSRRCTSRSLSWERSRRRPTINPHLPPILSTPSTGRPRA